jgi:DNA modification methylase
MTDTVSAPQIELRPIEHLVPYARNSKTHSDEQVALIQSSMLEWGFTNPILADGNGIVAGHGRVMAASRLYAAGQTLKFPNGAPVPAGMVPVLDCTGWTEAQRRAYVIADNRLAEKGASWDADMLRIEVADLQELGFDLDLTGFSADDLALMFADADPPVDRDPDDVPDVPATPHSKPGDVWVCGPHRIMCGDSLSTTDWDKLMQGELADLCWTDPPYNVAYESKLAGSIKNDDMGDKEFRDFLFGAYSCLFAVLKPGASIYVAHADTEGYNFRGAFLDAGFKLSGCLIWKKNALVLGRSPYQWIHEPILFGWRPGASHKFFGGRKQTTVAESGDLFQQREDGSWVIEVGGQVLVVSGDAKVEGLEPSVVFHEKPKRSEKHPTTKPTGLITKQLKNSGRPNDIVVDAFGGSGSTMIAADMVGMCARLMELDPKFSDVQAQRYFEFTGRVPVHLETGEPFPVDRSAKSTD